MPALVVLFAFGVDVHGIHGTPRATCTRTCRGTILRFSPRELGGNLLIVALLSLVSDVPTRHATLVIPTSTASCSGHATSWRCRASVPAATIRDAYSQHARILASSGPARFLSGRFRRVCARRSDRLRPEACFDSSSPFSRHCARCASMAVVPRSDRRTLDRRE